MGEGGDSLKWTDQGSVYCKRGSVNLASKSRRRVESERRHQVLEYSAEGDD